MSTILFEVVTAPGRCCEGNKRLGKLKDAGADIRVWLKDDATHFVLGSNQSFHDGRFLRMVEKMFRKGCPDSLH